MRTTVTLSAEAHSLVQSRMAERGVSFREALNDAIIAGLRPESPIPFKSRTFDLGNQLLPLNHASQVAGELEDEELIRKAELGK